jgi:beta-ketodecanoyl-[acyl-carrier-protein] synthase
MSNPIVISGLGLWIPEYKVSNEELVEAYNGFAEKFNTNNAAQIEAGEVEAKPLSSAEFISKASGIESRYVYRKEGILDVDRMRPKLDVRPDSELSHQAEMGVNAARKALTAANKQSSDIDAVILATSNPQRPYPSTAIEIQDALGIEGVSFEVAMACSSATFALQRAYEMIAVGTVKTVLMVNLELGSPQNNWRDRDSHFIFGDVANAVVLEKADTCQSDSSFEILDTKTVTTFSNNIRCNFSYLSCVDDSEAFGDDKFFIQQGRKVFKEVCPMAAEHMSSQLADLGIDVNTVKRWWVHQANINMNSLIMKRVLGREATAEEAPIILAEYANTASAGSVVSFILHHADFERGDIGMLCSFGAGYSVGSLVLRKR